MLFFNEHLAYFVPQGKCVRVGDRGELKSVFLGGKPGEGKSLGGQLGSMVTGVVNRLAGAGKINEGKIKPVNLKLGGSETLT
jgi:hypothetical protein